MLSTVDFSAAAVDYTRFRVDGNKGTFIGPSHSDITKDMIILTSASPKQNNQSYGNRRSSLNCVSTEQVAIPNTADLVRRDMKIEVLSSIPVGVSYDSFKERVARVRGLLSNEAFVQNLFLTGQLDY
jgi:hypothetical protein